LRTLPRSFECFIVETEFWGQMTQPNLLVQISAQHLGDLVSALALHAGEVKRNPYHLRLPAWMMDNVRRAEIVSGRGTTAPDFAFGVIYRLRKWESSRLVDAFNGGKVLSCAQNPGLLFA
jgi:hypothetical protein